jgi:WhiB family transcriptional regulator, redox-sensing transcriptional regulator
VLKDCNHPVIEGTEICATCPRPDDWQQHAKCLDHDPEMFFCEADDATNIKRAVRICLSCPTRGFCLEDAWESKQRFGIWGSFSAAERERLKKAFPLPDDPKDRRKVIRVIAHRL